MSVGLRKKRLIKIALSSHRSAKAPTLSSRKDLPLRYLNSFTKKLKS